MKNRILVISFPFVAFLAQAQNIPDGATSSSINNTNSVNPPSAFPSTGMSYNYVRTWLPYIPIQSPSSLNATGTVVATDASMTTEYSDGFGRTIQRIKRFNSEWNDLIECYDNRPSTQKLQFLPYPAAYNSKFRSSPYTEQKSFYAGLYPNEGNTAAKASVYSSSPSERATTTYNAGKSFFFVNGVKSSSNLNGLNEVRSWELNLSTYLIDLANSGYYAPNTLVKKITYNNADGAESIHYYDMSGKLVCSKDLTFGSCGNSSCPIYLTTYFLYDNVDRLVMTVTPKATDLLSSGSTSVSQVIENLCTYVKYDPKGRIWAKHTPGQQGLEYCVYDKKNRTVLTQTPLLSTQNKWYYTLYDKFDRVTVTGIVTSPLGMTSQNWQTWCDDYTQMPFYALHNQPDNLEYFICLMGGEGYYPASLGTNNEILSYTYYDDYSNTGNASFDLNHYSPYLATNNSYFMTPVASMKVNGKVTGKKIRVDNQGTNLTNWTVVKYFYDQYGNIIQQHATNAQGGTDILSTQYYYTGQPVRQILKHTNPLCLNKTSTAICTYYNYSSRTRKLTSLSQSIDNTNVQHLVSYTHDNLGRISFENLGSSTENRNYTYNIRGQLDGINKDYAEFGTFSQSFPTTFGESIKYDFGFTNSQMNGNISGIIWKGNGSNSLPQAYGYSYDPLGRLTNAEYNETNYGPGGSFVFWNNQQRDYTVSNLSYDLNGNVKTMDQMGVAHLLVNGSVQTQIVQMDNLQYFYEHNGQSNKLSHVNDIPKTTNQTYNLPDFIDDNSQPVDYTYDLNGNLTSDNNKNIQSISYNYLNKPVHIQYANGDHIIYKYDALGNKVREQSAIGGTTKTYDFIGPLVYVDNVLQVAHNERGRARYNSSNSSWEYDFFVKDHLGNVRNVIAATPTNMMQYLATHEILSANIENVTFDNIPAVRDDRPDGSPINLEAARLNANEPDRRLGTAIMLQVTTGDKFQISSEAYYGEFEPEEYISAEEMTTSIITTLVEGQGGFSGGIEGFDGAGMANTLFSTDNYLNGFNALKEELLDPTKPRASINYVLYDRDFNLIPEQSGAVQVDQSGQWHSIGLTSSVTVEENGYLVIFIGNETKADVWFDNVAVKFWRGNCLEENHYYPHGLFVSKLTTPPPVDKQNLYQTKEWTPSIKLYDFHARHYDPQLGRFTGLDPKGQFSSGYVGMGNNPVCGIDPDGQWVNFVIGAVIGGFSGYMAGRSTGATGWEMAGYIIGGAAIGAASSGLASSVTAGVSSSMSVALSSSVAGGVIAGAAGGATSGLIAGYGNAILTGTDPLEGGLRSAAYGGALGAISGGFSQGLKNYRGGYNIWTGKSVKYYQTGTSNQSWQSARANARAYDRSSLAQTNDKVFKQQLLNEFCVSEGDMNIALVTTRAQGFGLTADGMYMRSDGTTFYASATKFSNGSSVFLQGTPGTLSLAKYQFQAIMGHELWHAYHFYAIPPFLFDGLYSEKAAYYYSAQVFFNNGDIANYNNVVMGAQSIGEWGEFPAMYNVPRGYGFSLR